jgi:hypothetical protein
VTVDEECGVVTGAEWWAEGVDAGEDEEKEESEESQCPSPGLEDRRPIVWKIENQCRIINIFRLGSCPTSWVMSLWTTRLEGGESGAGGAKLIMNF